MKKADISLKSTEFKKQSVIIKDPEEMKRLSLVVKIENEIKYAKK